jgi:hypothetical protein
LQASSHRPTLAARKLKRTAAAEITSAGITSAAMTAAGGTPHTAACGVPQGEAQVPPTYESGEAAPSAGVPSDALLNVLMTQAEYLCVASERADAGFDTLGEACEHATDMLMVRDAYMQGQ